MKFGRVSQEEIATIERYLTKQKPLPSGGQSALFINFFVHSNFTCSFSVVVRY